MKDDFFESNISEYNNEENIEKNENIEEAINKIVNVQSLDYVTLDESNFTPRINEDNINNEQQEQKMDYDYSSQIENKNVSNIDEKTEYRNDVVFISDLLDRLKVENDKKGTISILVRYGDDLCSKNYITNPAIGRDEEIKQLLLTLLTPEKSGILVGKPGIGKTSIVEGLAYKIQRGDVPDLMKGYSIINVKTASLLGTLPTGETRLQTLVDELKTLDKVMLFIDEIHMLIGATNESAMDFANMFKEGLGRGQIKVIGATTTEEYERYILRDKAFVRRFQQITVEEPNREHTVKIMMGTLPKIEKETGAKMKYTPYIQSEIMGFIVDITSEFKRIYGIGSRYPDICLTMLKEAFSQCIFENRHEVDIFDVRKAIENSRNIYDDVKRKELPNFDIKFKKIIDEEKGIA